MIGLLVTGHGHFADGIHTSANMIAGESEYVRYVNFEEGMSTEQLAEKLNDETCTALRDAFGEKSAFLEQLARTLLNRRS